MPFDRHNDRSSGQPRNGSAIDWARAWDELNKPARIREPSESPKEVSHSGVKPPPFQCSQFRTVDGICTDVLEIEGRFVAGRTDKDDLAGLAECARAGLERIIGDVLERCFDRVALEIRAGEENYRASGLSEVVPGAELPSKELQELAGEVRQVAKAYILLDQIPGRRFLCDGHSPVMFRAVRDLLERPLLLDDSNFTRLDKPLRQFGVGPYYLNQGVFSATQLLGVDEQQWLGAVARGADKETSRIIRETVANSGNSYKAYEEVRDMIRGLCVEFAVRSHSSGFLGDEFEQ